MSENNDGGTVLVEVWLRFDGYHGEGLEFVEAETPDGESINLGEWDVGGGGSTLKLEVPERCVNTEGGRDSDNETAVFDATDEMHEELGHLVERWRNADAMTWEYQEGLNQAAGELEELLHTQSEVEDNDE